MNTSMYQIEQEYFDLMMELEESGGELTPEIVKALDMNKQNFEQKCINCRNLIVATSNNNTAIDEEIKRLQELKKSNGIKIKGVKKVLLNAIKLFGVKGATNYKYDFGLFNMYTRRINKLSFHNEEDFIAQYHDSDIIKKSITYTNLDIDAYNTLIGENPTGELKVSIDKRALIKELNADENAYLDVQVIKEESLTIK